MTDKPDYLAALAKAEALAEAHEALGPCLHRKPAGVPYCWPCQRLAIGLAALREKFWTEGPK